MVNLRDLIEISVVMLVNVSCMLFIFSRYDLRSLNSSSSLFSWNNEIRDSSNPVNSATLSVFVSSSSVEKSLKQISKLGFRKSVSLVGGSCSIGCYYIPLKRHCLLLNMDKYDTI